MNTKKVETEKRHFDIVAGPNKDTLFDACKYAGNKDVKIPVTLTIAIGYTMPTSHPGCAYIPMKIKNIKIMGIENEDGSGESFNFYGYCDADLDSFGKNATYAHYNFRAYYSSKNRKGCITFSE